MCPDEDNPDAEWDIRIQESCTALECANIRDTDVIVEDAPVNREDFPECATTPVVATMLPLPAGIPVTASISSGFSNDAGGSFRLELVNHFPPPYAQCENALSITVDAAPVDLNFANTVDDREGGCVPAGKNLWFFFVGTGNQLAVRVCSKTFESANPQVRIQDGCDADRCICDSSGEGCDRTFLNSTECPKGHQQLIFTEEGKTYHAYVGRDLLRTDLLVDIQVETYIPVDDSNRPTMFIDSEPSEQPSGMISAEPTDMAEVSSSAPTVMDEVPSEAPTDSGSTSVPQPTTISSEEPTDQGEDSDEPSVSPVESTDEPTPSPDDGNGDSGANGDTATMVMGILGSAAIWLLL